MSLAGKIYNISLALVLLFCSILLVVDPVRGYFYVVIIVDIALIIYGVKRLAYYFMMARHMVGGLSIFYNGLIFLDLGVFVLFLNEIPKKTAMLYLVGIALLAGAKDVFHSVHAKQHGGSWRYEMTYGIVKIIIAILCLGSLGDDTIMTYLLVAYLVHNAVTTFISAFRKTAVVYID